MACRGPQGCLKLGCIAARLFPWHTALVLSVNFFLSHCRVDGNMSSVAPDWFHSSALCIKGGIIPDTYAGLFYHFYEDIDILLTLKSVSMPYSSFLLFLLHAFQVLSIMLGLAQLDIMSDFLFFSFPPPPQLISLDNGSFKLDGWKQRFPAPLSVTETKHYY